MPIEETPVESQPEVLTAPRRRGPKGCWLVALLVLGGLGFWIGPVVRDFIKIGILDTLKKPEMRSYSGATIDNLRAMQMALSQYHESEGSFPESSGWMDAIEPRIQVFDMAKNETEKKMVSPMYRNQPGKYGYAMNDACSKKYKDDIPEPEKTPLVFDSSDLTRNAHGDPAKLLPSPPRDGANQGISVEGQLLKL